MIITMFLLLWLLLMEMNYVQHPLFLHIKMEFKDLCIERKISKYLRMHKHDVLSENIKKNSYEKIMQIKLYFHDILYVFFDSHIVEKLMSF